MTVRYCPLLPVTPRYSPFLSGRYARLPSADNPGTSPFTDCFFDVAAGPSRAPFGPLGTNASATQYAEAAAAPTPPVRCKRHFGAPTEAGCVGGAADQLPGVLPAFSWQGPDALGEPLLGYNSPPAPA